MQAHNKPGTKKNIKQLNHKHQNKSKSCSFYLQADRENGKNWEQKQRELGAEAAANAVTSSPKDWGTCSSRGIHNAPVCNDA